MYPDEKKKASEELGIPVEVYDELLLEFIPDALADIRGLGEAVKADDYDKAAQIAHGLKGMAGNLKLARIKNAAYDIETASFGNKDKQAIMGKISELERDLFEL
ncbi:MAG: Hpt domain-containing protein [Candidatus Omnitrophica bacterium]|nr:Hpt domain-containing protein [Candidatus Omnitrophota bacterium]